MPPTNIQTSEIRRHREAKAQTPVKHEQLKIDLQSLHTSVNGKTWSKAAHHIIVQGMKSRKDWREQQCSLYKKQGG